MARAVVTVLRGLATGLRARPWLFAGLTGGVLALHVALPVLVLSVSRKPVDFFMVNPWLENVPRYLSTSELPLSARVERLWNLALFWFSSSNAYGTEWGFAVDARDLARMTVASLLIAAYFTLSRHRRAIVAAPRVVSVQPGARAGVLGACASVLGLTSGPCSVMGCGAPVIPVVGLAFAGLSSTTLHLLRDLSSWASVAMLVGITSGVVYLAWAAGNDRAASAASA